jgi:CRP-like cAMP-binding protein
MPKVDPSLIGGLPLFEGLSVEDLKWLLETARSSLYPKNQAIFEQEEEAHSFFLLLDGHVRVVRTTPDGQQLVMRYISPGEVFGIAPALGRTTYPATAIAAVDCVALAWPTSQWGEIAGRLPAFVANVYRIVGQRLEESHRKIEEIATEQVEQRVAHAILRLANQTGKPTSEGLAIDFPLSRQDIAEMTGTTLHTVSRLLSGWEAAGLVRSGRQKVIVTDVNRLGQIAEGGSK